MQLHQFRHSAFCEKVRLVLAVKRLPYTVVEVTPGLGQLALFRLSGQRQVPVLVDGSEVIADSSAIALYLEANHPSPALLPVDPGERARVLLLEDWADTALAGGVRQALLQAAVEEADLRAALLPVATPAPLRTLVGAVPGSLLAGLGQAVDQGGLEQLRQNLSLLTALVATGHYLVGDRLSLADLAVAGQLSLLKFPQAAGAPLAGWGVPGLADDPQLEPLFHWRDRIGAEVGRP